MIGGEQGAMGKVDFDARVNEGRPVVSGTDISVKAVLDELAAGKGLDEIAAEHSSLDKKNISEAIRFAGYQVDKPRFTWLLLIPVIAFLLAAAHFLRWGETGLVISSFLAIAMLGWREGWVRIVLQGLLMLTGLRWVQVAQNLMQMRLQVQAPWLRMILILGAVALFSFAGVWMLGRRKSCNWFRSDGCVAPPVCAFFITFAAIAWLNFSLPFKLLLFERYLPGTALLQAFLMSVYAAWLTHKLYKHRNSTMIRSRIWFLFSMVFFAQLALGLAGFSRMLMTGKLHLPVPALIVAGPIYRNSGFFMLFLFIGTVLMVGPAWCSYLCYIGAWEDRLRRRASKPQPLPVWRHKARVAILLIVLGAAVLLRLLNTPATTAVVIAAIFGIMGIAIMALVSGANGQMTHCTTWCPMGLIANWLGRISPFRIKFGKGCTDCMLCTKACAYDALSKEHVSKRKPGSTCTLCGDCVASCHGGHIGYSLPFMSSDRARTIFVVTIVVMHAVFLTVARI